MAEKVSINAAGSSGDEESNPLVSLLSMQRVSLSLSGSFLGDQDVSDYCLELLHDFGQRYASLVTCLVFNARPVTLCQNCYTGYNSFLDVYANISFNQVSINTQQIQYYV